MWSQRVDASSSFRPLARLVREANGAQILGASFWRTAFCEAGEAMIAIGPEGGFAEHEMKVAWEAGWKSLSLGSRILRVETAAMVVAAWFGSPAT